MATKLVLHWQQNLNLKSLKNYKPETLIEHEINPDEFQFDNGLICGEDTGFAFLDKSSDEEN
jgi:hypothetical protein